MKKILCLCLVFMLMSSVALATEPEVSTPAGGLDLSDLSFMEDASDDELMDLRDLIDEELKSRKKDSMDADDVEATRDNPAPIGSTVIYKDTSYSSPGEYIIRVECVATGDTSSAIAKSFARYNTRQLKKGQQWVLVQLYLEALSSEVEKVDLSSYNFKLVSQDGVEYERGYLSDNPAEVKALYVGSKQYAWVGAIVEAGDTPALTYKSSATEDDTAWFSLAERIPFTGDELSAATLDKNSTSDDVIFLQRELVTLGYYKFNPNGEYDKNMTSAVKSFQKANSLKQSGNADEATIACLFSGEAIKSGK